MPDEPAISVGALSDLCTPWCIHVVATLRIAEHIASGVNQIDQLASVANCDQFVLHRILEHLVRIGIFEQPEAGYFSLNEAAKGLLDEPLRLGLDLDNLGGRLAHAWGTLLAFVRTGQPAYQDVFGRPFWDDLDAHPNLAASFDALIGIPGHGVPDPHFELAAGWHAVRTIVDVGGGTGAMLAEVLRSRPQLHGTLVDLPRTAERARETFESAGVADRVTIAAQSFFDPLPAGADVYLLRGVLNDWPDAEAAIVLRRCAEAARPRGRVVILKSVGPDGVPRPISIEMVLVGGKHRTISEFRELASECGLEVVAARKQGPGYFVVECTTNSIYSEFQK
jgi:hypothetical protein